MTEPLLEVRDLVKHFPITRGVVLQKQVGAVRAVDGVSFEVERGTTLGLVGETGCGKSTTAKLLTRLLDPTSGSIKLAGEEISHAGGGRLKQLRREMQMIFQDPYSSLNPRKTVGSIIGEPFAIHGLHEDRAARRGAKKDKRWAGRVRSGDHPINVEGADFRADGRLLLGLRYPVTAEGHPLLVELDDLDSLFSEEDPMPRCGAVWALDDVGSADCPLGVRALHGDGDDRFHAVLGNLDAANKGATVLEDNPEGGRADSMHVRFELPLVARGGAVQAEHVHTFEGVRRVEGVALGDGGHAHYVIDEEGQVALRTLVLD